MIKYKAGYKYRLEQDFDIHVGIYPSDDIRMDYLFLSIEGYLFIKKGYAWDGPSGEIKLGLIRLDFTPDTKPTMTPSLVHDALYQLMRQKQISLSHRLHVDKLFHKMLLERRFSKWKAWLWYKAVRWGARKSALPENKREVLTAP